ncbi:RHS repeat-associated core domain-containing protein [Bordetella sp. LUAb4]|uniref:RHS repeat-associated core domain-containing protein n=1 Tax=Bordetella sp. LUAb4 TaxID=2843195 RepID=UPI001E61C5BD|nr:RHS repeat-associated core domain-containing protein [Bordetella sp. LUAb4]
MATLCAGTPKISVRDNRGLEVRTLRYNRTAAGAVAAQYVDARTHNVLGQPATSQDPRFFGGSTLNFQNTSALSGLILKTVSADAGTSKACTDIAGRPIWQYSEGRDAALPSDKKITVQLSYDALGRPIQRTCSTADISGGGPSGNPTDIWAYGDYNGPAGAAYAATNTADPRNANQRGQLFQHFDTAGLIDMSVLGYAVQSAALRQDRRFLASPCDASPRWNPAPLKQLYGLNKGGLESDTDPANLYSTRWAYNALAQVLTQVDAKGHQQHTAYDSAGRKYTASATPNGGALIPVCAGITYTAAGAIDARTDANTVKFAYVYEPQTTQRLISLTTTRVSTPLQALTYAYDGVGNVVTLSDNSAGAQVSFFRNRAVTPDRGYTYDALYQLISATGRENYVDTTPKGTDWPDGQFDPVSKPDYQTYTRSYTYDTGGNLTGISSSNWSGSARTMVVGAGSNRAVSTANNAGATQANIDTYFDLAGQSICLDANRNQPMYWSTFHELYCVVTAYRTPTGTYNHADWGNSDREQYAYDGDGQRVRKYASSLANGSWNTLDTRYLPGLELRENSASGENLEVIVLDDGARVLNWAGGAGKPSDIPNLQLRFQYTDRQDSCQIETDKDGNIITQEEYYPYGGTAVLTSRSNSEVKYKYIRYSGKERDATGFYYYGQRYYQPWIGRWINPDPAGTVDGQNLYCMVGNNPVTQIDSNGLSGRPGQASQDDPPEDQQMNWAMAGPSGGFNPVLPAASQPYQAPPASSSTGASRSVKRKHRGINHGVSSVSSQRPHQSPQSANQRSNQFKRPVNRSPIKRTKFIAGPAEVTYHDIPPRNEAGTSTASAVSAAPDTSHGGAERGPSTFDPLAVAARTMNMRRQSEHPTTSHSPPPAAPERPASAMPAEDLRTGLSSPISSVESAMAASPATSSSGFPLGSPEATPEQIRLTAIRLKTFAWLRETLVEFKGIESASVSGKVSQAKMEGAREGLRQEAMRKLSANDSMPGIAQDSELDATFDSTVLLRNAANLTSKKKQDGAVAIAASIFIDRANNDHATVRIGYINTGLKVSEVGYPDPESDSDSEDPQEAPTMRGSIFHQTEPDENPGSPTAFRLMTHPDNPQQTLNFKPMGLVERNILYASIAESARPQGINSIHWFLQQRINAYLDEESTVRDFAQRSDYVDKTKWPGEWGPFYENQLSPRVGVPGAHAEVLAFNDFLNQQFGHIPPGTVDGLGSNREISDGLRDFSIITLRLQAVKGTLTYPDSFKPCNACSRILGSLAIEDVTRMLLKPEAFRQGTFTSGEFNKRLMNALRKK